MPSPFPGMDPFLEAPALFPGLHDRLVVGVSDFLQARLPEPYYAEIGERVWIEIAHRYIEPDVNVLRREREAAKGEPAGGVAVAAAARTQPVVVKVPHDEHRETFVGIYADRDKGERLVTSLELLSWSNKTPGEHGRDLYLRKQRELLNSETHLVEIDLLRGGEHATAVPRDYAVAQAGPFDYHVSVHRFDNLEEYFVYPIQLAHRLPEIAVPLLPGDSPVPIDLQVVFDRAYDSGPYRRRVRYAEAAAVPPLRPEQAEWVRQVLTEKGLT